METIGVSEQVKERLEELKEVEGHTSFDSLVRMLLLQYRCGRIALSKEELIALHQSEECIVIEESDCADSIVDRVEDDINE